MSERWICVYAGSSAGADPAYAKAAGALAEALVARGYGLVYGGGRVGLMGAVADGVMRAGGEVVGVIPRALDRREVAHREITELRVVESMHERKAAMADLACAFVALPGGLGTIEELAEVATWTQLGIQHKPIGLLDVRGYWAPLVELLDHAVREGFLRSPHRDLIQRADDPGRLLDALERWEPRGKSEGDRPRELR